MRRHPRSRRPPGPTPTGLGLGLAVALVLALGTAACGGSGADAQVATAGGGDSATKDAAVKDAKETDPEQAGLDFARCMREHGVDMPDPQSGGGGFIKVGPGEVAGKAMRAGEGLPDDFAAADEACRHFLEDLIQEGGPPMDAEAQDKALRFARCMREHGVDMPDPDFSGGPGGGGLRIEIGIGGIDPGSETFQAAQEACGELFGPGGPGGARAGVVSSGGKS